MRRLPGLSELEGSEDVTSPSIGMDRTSGIASAETQISSYDDSQNDSLNLEDSDDLANDIYEWKLGESSERLRQKVYGDLPEDEEREIHLKVKENMKHEIRRIYLEARSRQEMIRKRFSNVINDARSVLIAARVEAEKVSICKLEEKAEEKQAVILKNRTRRENHSTQRLPANAARVTELRHAVDTNKILAEELGILRKIQADLDRARARRKYSVFAAMFMKNGKMKVTNLQQTEVRRLQKEEDVYELVDELRDLELHEHANKLLRAMRAKVESENRLRQKLSEERLLAQKNALRRLEDEKTKLRRKRWTEKETEERARIERERMEKIRRERERLRRIMMDLKRQARNMEFRKSFESAIFSASVSRSFSYSYFGELPKCRVRKR